MPFSELSETHEAKQVKPWRVSNAPAEYIEKVAGAIVGIEIPITKLEGKWKVSQSRLQSDKVGVVAGLELEGSENACAISKIIQGAST